METFLRQLYDIEGVSGVALIGTDGLTFASLMDDPRAEAHAAHAAAAFDTLVRYTRQLAVGGLRQVIVEAANAVIALTEAGDLIVVVEAAPSVNQGRLKLESARVARAVTARPRG